MRINIYAEEITDQVEIISKTSDEGTFTGLRFWLHLPVTIPNPLRGARGTEPDVKQISGPFMHRPGDDDSSAVTFWGKRAMIPVLERALELLRQHYEDTPSHAD